MTSIFTDDVRAIYRSLVDGLLSGTARVRGLEISLPPDLFFEVHRQTNQIELIWRSTDGSPVEVDLPGLPNPDIVKIVFESDRIGVVFRMCTVWLDCE